MIVSRAQLRKEIQLICNACLQPKQSLPIQAGVDCKTFLCLSFHLPYFQPVHIQHSGSPLPKERRRCLSPCLLPSLRCLACHFPCCARCKACWETQFSYHTVTPMTDFREDRSSPFPDCHCWRSRRGKRAYGGGKWLKKRLNVQLGTGSCSTPMRVIILRSRSRIHFKISKLFFLI